VQPQTPITSVPDATENHVDPTENHVPASSITPPNAPC
jgi:hypothetical protein